ncbi:porin family protein [Methylorubrum sp. SB2]|uniref:outer membrane protein n=1 Tax=Methylorubrum subtropicum TaxID=3138812 RepID=UPI00313ED8A3
MRRRLLVSASLLASALCAGGAVAADLPARAAPPVFTPVPVFTWTGLYGGFNLGYAWSHDRVVTRALDGPDTGFTRQAIAAIGFERIGLDSGGFTGGGQVGANYQFTPGAGLVVGVEADAQYTDLRRRRTGSGGFVQPIGGGLTIQNDFEAEARGRLSTLGTVRGRLGYAFDRVLVYGTGGFAYGETTYGSRVDQVSTCANCPGGPVVVDAVTTGGRRGMQTGYAYGGGIEVALPATSVLNLFGAAAVTLKAEYLHYDLGTRTIVAAFEQIPSIGPARQTSVSRIRTEGDLARVGLNFKFGVD